MRFVAFAFAGLSLATMAFAQGGDPRRQAPSSTERESAGKGIEKEERTCRWVHDADSGSLIRGRTRRCLTAEQWRSLSRR